MIKNTQGGILGRIRRYIFNTLTVVSLLVMLATVGLWVDSYWNCSLVEYTTADSTGVYISSTNLEGVNVGVTHSGHPEGGWSASRTSYEGLYIFPEEYSFNFYGFAYYWEQPGAVGNWLYGVHFPHWFLALFFAVLPGIWFIKWRKRRKLAMVGSCPSCGYDLTGNESGECPECGQASELEAAQT